MPRSVPAPLFACRALTPEPARSRADVAPNPLLTIHCLRLLYPQTAYASRYAMAPSHVPVRSQAVSLPTPVPNETSRFEFSPPSLGRDAPSNSLGARDPPETQLAQNTTGPKHDRPETRPDQRRRWPSIPQPRAFPWRQRNAQPTNPPPIPSPSSKPDAKLADCS